MLYDQSVEKGGLIFGWIFGTMRSPTEYFLTKNPLLGDQVIIPHSTASKIDNSGNWGNAILLKEKEKTRNFGKNCSLKHSNSSEWPGHKDVLEKSIM